MIHKFKLCGYNVVTDSESGAVHSFDNCAYDVLEHYPEKSAGETARLLSNDYPSNEIYSCVAEIDELIKDGLLFSDGAAEAPSPGGGRIVKALCLHAAHDCNLRCAYCFAKEGGYRGERELMPLETGIAAVDFLIANSGNRTNLEIDFFGGEPLMNFETVKKIAAYCREMEPLHNKRFRFTLTTNGVLLNDREIDFINDQMDNVVLSLDGRREVNDRMRRTTGGRGSYDSVLPKFLRLVGERNGERYFIRGTYTRGNLDFSEDVKHLAALGFKKISVEPVVAPLTEEFALQPSDAEALCAEYEKLAAHMLEKKGSGDAFEFFHFNVDLEGGPCLKKRATGCGAGDEYLAVSPGGRLYPCHQFVGMEEFAVGDVFGGIKNNEVRERFIGNTLHKKMKCASCWAKYYCGGGCAANAYYMNGDITEPYELVCVLHRKRCECALMLKAAEAI